MERINVTCGNVLRMSKGRDLGEIIQEIENSINRTVNRNLKVTPEEAINRKTLVDMVGVGEEVNTEELVLRIKEPANKERYLRNENRKMEYKFEENDLIFCRKMDQKKYDKYWKGPFKVARVPGENPSYLEIDKGNFTEKVNIKQIRPWKRGTVQNDV